MGSQAEIKNPAWLGGYDMKFQRQSTIEQGYAYYEENRVSKLKPVIDGKRTAGSGRLSSVDNTEGSYTYSAEVSGDSGIHHTEVTLNRQLKLIDGHCDCPAFETYHAPCKHIAAVAYKLGSHLGGGFGMSNSAAKSLIQLEVGTVSKPENPYTKERASSSAILQCMDQLEVLNDPDYIPIGSHNSDEASLANVLANGGEKVRIEPALIWDQGQVRVELTLGTSRQYVVRNMKTLCKSLCDGEPLLFGKGLRLSGSLSEFDRDSRDLLEFFLKQYRQLIELRSFQTSHRVDDLVDQLFSDGGRSMIMTPQALDDFLELTDGRTFLFEKRYRFLYSHLSKNRMGRSQQEPGFQIPVRTQEGQPILPLTLTPEDDGVLLKAECLPFRCKGHRHLYVLMDQNSEILWKTDADYRQKMEPFLDSLERTDKELFIANHDLPRFCSNVFSHIRQWLDIDGDVEYLDRFMPWDMEAQLYLDSPAPGVITARPLVDYGTLRINLVNERQEIVEDLAIATGSASHLRRNDVQESRFSRLLDRWFTEIDLPAGMMVIRDDDDAVYEFLNHGQAELASRSRLFVTDRYKRLMFPAKNKISAGVSISGQLLNVTFDLEGFPPEELGELLSSYRVKRRYYKLKDGSYLSLEEGEARDAMELASGLQLTKEEMNAGRAQLPRYRALYVEELSKSTGELTVHRHESFRQLVRSIHDIEQSNLAIPESLVPILRDYQKTGYRWLKTMSDLGFGGILADDMGLGKTLEVITLLTAASAESKTEIPTGDFNSETISDPEILALVTCPSSLVWNWAKELERFSPELKAFKISGNAAIRKKQLAELKDLPLEDQRRCVVITSYDLLKRDLAHYSDLYFQYHILDEAQYIKNFATKNAKAVNALRSRVRFALTGTPIENRLSDLWSIFHFLMPGYLGNYQQFKNQYERPIVEEKDDTASQLLHAQVRPFILRRLKQNVLKELPEKMESVIYVPLEGEQQKLYMANLAKAKLEVGSSIAEGGFETNQLEILALLTRLRQICCHPALCYEDYTGPSAKLETCMELIRESITAGHRVLLFSQFTSMLSLIENALRAEDIPYYLLTGQTPKATRQNLVTSFNEGTIPVFLISLKAGGTGLNLTGADVVIHFDPWWNIAAQNQATDRAHRIGQRRSVQVYKLVADNTIEDKILKLQAMKGTLADSIIQSVDPDSILQLFQDDFV